MYTFKNNIKSVFPFIGISAVKFSEGIFENVTPPDMDGEFFPPNAFVLSFELSSEVPPLHIKIKYPRMIHKNRERTVGEVGGGLSEYLVEYRAVCFRELKELELVRRQSFVCVGGHVAPAGAVRSVRLTGSLLIGKNGRRWSEFWNVVAYLSRVVFRSRLAALAIAIARRRMNKEESLNGGLQNENRVMIGRVFEFQQTGAQRLPEVVQDETLAQ